MSMCHVHFQVPNPLSPTELTISGPEDVTMKFKDPPGPSHLPPVPALSWAPNATLDDLTGLIYEADVTRKCILQGEKPADGEYIR